MNQEKNSMLFGRMVGIIMIVLGLVLSAIGYTMLNDAGFTIRLFIAGPPLFLVGIAMLLVPGQPITIADSRETNFDSKQFFNDSPLMHKIIWIIAGLAGILFAFQFVEIV